MNGVWVDGVLTNTISASNKNTDDCCSRSVFDHPTRRVSGDAAGNFGGPTNTQGTASGFKDPPYKLRQAFR